MKLTWTFLNRSTPLGSRRKAFSLGSLFRDHPEQDSIRPRIDWPLERLTKTRVMMMVMREFIAVTLLDSVWYVERGIKG
jgi:hypothetical protein